MGDTPTIEETHRAKEIYLRGMNANYPGVDPRLSLLGMKENGWAYQTEGFGFRLERIPSKRERVARELMRGIGTGSTAYVLVTILSRWF